MGRYVLPVVAFVVATFATQAVSHFVINADHYASVPYLRDEPIMPLGVLAMLVQGGILSYLFARLGWRSIADALRFAWLAGAFLLSYMALAEAAKYDVPAVGSWIGVEASAGFVQFTLYGLALGLVCRPRPSTSPAPP